MESANPDDLDAYEQRLATVTIGKPERLTERIVLSDYDPAWPDAYEREAARVGDALGARALAIQHVGSTSVPGLPAKPIIDVLLEVSDSSDEPAYVPDLEAAGYVLRIREQDWFEHRLFKDLRGGGVNLHVFSSGCLELERMLQFRDWLRDNAADRDLYARSKRELASQQWAYMQQYADAKTEVIGEILGRARPRSTVSSSPPLGRCA